MIPKRWMLCCLWLCAPMSGNLQWTTSALSLQDGARVQTCSGQTVDLAWSYNLTAADHLVDVEWYFSPAGSKETLIATRVRGNFLVVPQTHQHRVTFLPNAGLRLHNVTRQDTGTYSVRVHVLGAMDAQQQVASVDVYEPPRTSDRSLHVQLLPNAVLSSRTGQWHVQLLCGRLISPGHPPVDMLWTTPSGASLRSTSHTNGTFILDVPNPVEGGLYTCTPDNSLPSVACVESASPFHKGASLLVNDVSARFSLLEGELSALRNDNSQLKHEVHNLHQENSNLSSAVSELRTELQQVINQHPSNCKDVLRENRTSGVYKLYPTFNHTLRVFCDQTTDGGGWTVIQRRQDGSVDFYQNWNQYEQGFGQLGGEFWLGLSNIHLMTSRGAHTLRVDLEDFDGSTVYATYDVFNISDRADNYRLHVSGYSGTAGDSLIHHNLMAFSTFDLDHDLVDYNCAVDAHGGYWYFSCTNSNLNGRYVSDTASADRGVYWYPWRGYRNLKHVEMKMRPN